MDICYVKVRTPGKPSYGNCNLTFTRYPTGVSLGIANVVTVAMLDERPERRDEADEAVIFHAVFCFEGALCK